MVDDECRPFRKLVDDDQCGRVILARINRDVFHQTDNGVGGWIFIDDSAKLQQIPGVPEPFLRRRFHLVIVPGQPLSIVDFRLIES